MADHRCDQHLPGDRPDVEPLDLGEIGPGVRVETRGGLDGVPIEARVNDGPWHPTPHASVAELMAAISEAEASVSLPFRLPSRLAAIFGRPVTFTRHELPEIRRIDAP